MSAWEFESTGPADTQAVAAALGRLLLGGEVIALDGALGAGKTQFAKGLAHGLDVPPDEPVVSPTFVLVREYRGRLTLYHVDAYRLAGADDLAAIGWDDLRSDGAGVVAVEWAERVAGLLPANAIRVEIEHVDGTRRRIRIATPDEALAAAFRAALAETPR
ncbi:MAG: tRNA (adenosine(37)-N6)-threonylcarbamoyltransferase complex ATPase subunit type 1 TsaE [Phycisphaerae bacterium]